MSEQRVVQSPTGEMTASDSAARDPIEIQRLREERKAKFIRVRHRGATHDKLQVELPESLYGEWISNDKFAIAEAEAIGFKVYTDGNPDKNSLHKQGDGTLVIGDAIFMVMDSEDKELHDEIRREEFNAANGMTSGVQQREEGDATSLIRNSGLPIIDESKARTARKAEIQEALAARSGGDPRVAETGVPRVNTIT